MVIKTWKYHIRTYWSVGKWSSPWAPPSLPPWLSMGTPWTSPLQHPSSQRVNTGHIRREEGSCLQCCWMRCSLYQAVNICVSFLGLTEDLLWKVDGRQNTCVCMCLYTVAPNRKPPSVRFRWVHTQTGTPRQWNTRRWLKTKRNKLICAETWLNLKDIML